MSQNRWFYLDGTQSIGPVSETKLAALLASKAVSRETLLWKQGSENWQSLEQVMPHLGVSRPTLPCWVSQGEADETELLTAASLVADLPNDRPALSTDTHNPWRRWEERDPHPWRRYFARVLDTSLNGSLVAFLLGVGFYAFDNSVADSFFTALGRNPAVDSVLTCILAMPANAVMIGLTGGSLGKWLFGVRVLDAAGQTIGIGRAFKREGRIWHRGLGFGIPIIAIITLIVALKHLNRAGTASWDREMGLALVHRPHGPLQGFLGVIGIASIIMLFVGLASLQ